jgi:hypothetical protein
VAGSVHQLSLINSPAVCSPSVEVLDRICKEAGWKLVKQLVLVLTGVCLTWGGSKKGELFRCRNLVYLYTYLTPSPMFNSRMTAICGLCWTSDGPRTFPPRFPWSTWQWIPLASFSSLAYVGSIDTACTPHGHRMDSWKEGGTMCRVVGQCTSSSGCLGKALSVSWCAKGKQDDVQQTHFAFVWYFLSACNECSHMFISNIFTYIDI